MPEELCFRKAPPAAAQRVDRGRRGFGGLPWLLSEKRNMTSGTGPLSEDSSWGRSVQRARR